MTGEGRPVRTHRPAATGRAGGDMRQILCYGDSNTWGRDPGDETRRFEWPVRWAGVLQRELGESYHVVEEGLGGRTTVYDDPLLPGRSGRDLLAAALECHAPLDLVVIMLGTNDISYAQLTAADAARGAAELAHLVRRSEAGPVGPAGPAPQALLICPPPVGPFTNSDRPSLWEGAVEKSRALPQEFARAAAAVAVPWFDAGEVVVTSALDGWHLEAQQHELLGVAVGVKVRELLGEGPPRPSVWA
jgi:lysophospholipase L1-like esterase